MKYSAIAIQNADTDEVIYEISFEDPAVIKKDEELTFLINNKATRYIVTSVTKVDHIITPNVLYDYRLLALPL
jgi:hypothetical protein